MKTEFEKIDATKAPDRIYGWEGTQMSIARHFGGIKYMGHGYTINWHEEGTPLVRDGVLKAEMKAARAALKERQNAYRTTT